MKTQEELKQEDDSRLCKIIDRLNESSDDVDDVGVAIAILRDRIVDLESARQPVAASVPPIWLLTVLFVRAHETDSPVVRGRTWGWFPDKKSAVQAIVGNDGDMYECGYYNMAVIEEIRWGSMATANSETWFSVTSIESEEALGDYNVKEIPKPALLEQMVCFGMG